MTERSPERQISVESLVAAYRDELATLNQRVVEQSAYARSLETAYADVLERLRKYEEAELEQEPEVDAEPAAAKAQQNGKAKAGSARR